MHARMPITILPTTSQEEVSNLRRIWNEISGSFSEVLAPPEETATFVVLGVIKDRAVQTRSLSIYLNAATEAAEDETVVLTISYIRAGVTTTLLKTATVAVTAAGWTDLSSNLASIQLQEDDVIKMSLAYAAGTAVTPINMGIMRLQVS